MKICVICPSFQPGRFPCGIGDYTAILVEHLSRFPELAITVVAGPNYTGRAGPGAIPAGPDTLPISDTIITRFDLTRCADTIRLFAFLRGGHFDIILVQYSPSLYGRFAWITFLSPLLRLFTRSRLVFSFHTMYGTFLSKLLVVRPLLFSHSLISTNEEIDSIFAGKLRWFKNKATSIPIGSNIFPPTAGPKKTILRTELGLEPDIPVLIYFGFYYPGKDIETLLEALAVLRGRKFRCQCILAGSPWPKTPDYYQSLRNLCTRLKLDDGCRWTGQQDRETVARYLAASDISVNPSRAGLTSRNGSVMASVTFHLPIIGSRAKASRYFIDNETCLLFEPGDSQSLARAIIRLAQDKSLAARLQTGSIRLSHQFDWQTIAGQHRDFFMRLAGRT